MFLGIVAMFLLIAPVSMLVEVSADGSPLVLVRTTNLVSPTGSVNPHGEAEFEQYQSGNRELEVEIEDVNLPAGTSLTAVVDGNSVGQIILESDRRGRLKLKTEFGQAVPVINNGSTVQVRNGSTVLVTGSFGGPTTTPTGSPTGSPTGTPTGSPTASPTGSPTASPTASPSPGNEFNLFAFLSGATLNGVLPRGFAEFEIHSSRTELEVRISQVNLSGTTLNVLVDNVPVGQLIISGNEGRLRLRSDRGENVPAITGGSQIVLKNGDATILTGRFTGGGTGPNPTPTMTPQPGRFFEGHLSGAQMNPPVNTTARGEIKIYLHSNETVAQAIGEYNLTSPQTSAKILCDVGSTTNLIFDFGALGGLERHYTVTFSVTPEKVQQLRTGLCYQIVASANFPNGEIRGLIRPDGRRSDFDGDGVQDLAVFRPTTETWYIQNSRGFSAQTFGSADDKLVSGDFDGDGRSDAAVFQNVGGLGVWAIRRSADGGTTTAQFGLATDIPVRGDFDGDGLNDLAVFRQSNGTWYINKSNGTGFIITQFGAGGDKPVAADLDGDGKTDIAVFRSGEGNWYWLRSSDGAFRGMHFGSAGDIPVAGDFDADGTDDITVYRPSNGAWYSLRSRDGSFSAAQFGIASDVPVAGDYDRDGKDDIAVFRAADGAWYILRSSDGAFEARFFGANGDIPTPAQ